MDFKVPILIPVWGIAIIPILVLITSLLIYLIMATSKKNAESKAEENKKSWIEKKDILYWLLIICLGSIFVFTFGYRTNEEAISHWGFAGTIVSIILAVVAIGFTLFQTLSHNLSSEKIVESAESIMKASTALEATDLLKASEILTQSSQTIAKYNSQLEKLTEDVLIIKNAQLNRDNKFESFFSNLESSSLGINDNASQSINSIVIEIEDFIDNIYPKIAKIPKFLIFSSLYLSNSDNNLSKKSIRIDFLNQFADLVTGEPGIREENEYISKKMYMRGASMGSLGAVRTLLRHFGVLNAFTEKDEENKNELLKKAGADISPEYMEFLIEFSKKSD